MQNPSIHRRRGFTLVELLVVITIIAVLAGAGFAAGNAAIQKAKKATALAAATSIESAVNSFYAEYGTLPVTNASATTLDSTSGAGVEMLRVLMGQEAGNDPLNTRGVKFLNLREAKGNKGGVVYTGTGTNATVQALYDPWGGPYKMVLDHDYDEAVTVNPSGGATANLNGRRIAVWSEGADFEGNKRPADDVKTW